MGNDMVSNSRGAVAILAGMTLVLLLGLASLVIDIGYGLVTRNALQNIADAASLAGTRELGRIYIPLTTTEQVSYQLKPLWSLGDCWLYQGRYYDGFGPTGWSAHSRGHHL